MLSRATSVLRDAGPRAFATKVLNETVYRKLILFERTLTDLVIPEREPLDLVISPLSLDEAGAYATLRPDQGADVCRARLQAGHVCLVARDGDLLAGHAWHATRDATIDYLEMTLPLAPDESYSYDTYTAPAYRGRRIALAFMDESARMLAAQGCTRVLGAALPNVNKPRTRTPDIVGAVPFGWLAVIRIGPWRKQLIRVDNGKRAPGAPV